MLICKKAVRAFALSCTSAKAREFSQVAPSFMSEVNRAVESLIRKKVEAHPSKGKTLRGSDVS